MKPEEIESTLEQYIRDKFYPTPDERMMVSEKYKELQSLLPESQFHIFQSGSYARTTSVTPVDDLDVICDSKNPQEDVKLLFKILERGYAGKVKKIKQQEHSIGIYFGEDEDFSIDVVPARLANNFPPNNDFGDYLYELPELLKHSKKQRKNFYASDTVLLSDPKGYYKQALATDKTSNGIFKRAVKFVKKWNYVITIRENSDTFQSFKSFHIEEIIKQFFIGNPHLSLMEALQKFYSEGDSYFDKPQILDRADQDGTLFVDSYLNEVTREGQKKIEQYLLNANSVITLLTIQEKPEIIIDLLDKFFSLQSPPKPPYRISVPIKSSPHFILGS